MSNRLCPTAGFQRIGRRTVSRVVCALLVACLAVACASNPRTGRRQLLLHDESSMNELGRQAYVEMTDPSKVPVSKDARLIDPLQRVGKAIAAAADQPDYAWEFTLIDDPKTVNAWALPGGKIAFYTGIYPILQDEAGMAIVMGHEVMHAILQHSNERMSHEGLTSSLLEGVSMGLGKSQYRDTIMGALGVGANVGVLLPYSRTHESEADHYGLLLAARAGYDPRAAIGVWQRMAELGDSGTPSILSTHPHPLDRIEDMKKWMPEALKLYEASTKQTSNPLPPITK